MNGLSIAKKLAALFRAGTIVALVKDADEALAVSEVEAGAAGCAPVKVKSGLAVTATDVEEHARGAGTLVLLDFLALNTDPGAARAVREVALQERADGQRYSRLVLIEQPHIEVPIALGADIEVVEAPLPTVDELLAELDGFIEAQPNVAPQDNGEQRYSLAGAGTGLARHEFARLLARSVIERGALDTAWIRNEKALRIGQKTGGALTFESTEGPEVGGLNALIGWLTKRIPAFASRRAREFGLPPLKGILIVGAPGTGKTLMARKVARMFGLPLIRGNIGLLFGSLVGETEKNVEAFIQAIDAIGECVLLLDEFEKAVAGMSGSGASTDSGTASRAGARLLSWMNDKTSSVFILATANRVEALGPEQLRKGRFDEIFAVGLPDAEERQEIARIHIERRNRDLGDDAPKAIAAATAGFVGAEIEQAVIDGLFTAFAADRDLELDDILTAVQETIPLSRTAPEAIRAIEKWAEERARPASSKPTTAAAEGEFAPRRRVRPVIDTRKGDIN